MNTCFQRWDLTCPPSSRPSEPASTSVGKTGVLFQEVARPPALHPIILVLPGVLVKVSRVSQAHHASQGWRSSPPARLSLPDANQLKLSSGLVTSTHHYPCLGPNSETHKCTHSSEKAGWCEDWHQARLGFFKKCFCCFFSPSKLCAPVKQAASSFNVLGKEKKKEKNVYNQTTDQTS